MDTRKNLTAVQPGIAYEPEGNGWPMPLVDDSSQITYKTTLGKSAETTSLNVDSLKTSQMKDGGHHLPEGHQAAGATDGYKTDGPSVSMRNQFETSQQILKQHHTPEGER